MGWMVAHQHLCGYELQLRERLGAQRDVFSTVMERAEDDETGAVVLASGAVAVDRVDGRHVVHFEDGVPIGDTTHRALPSGFGERDSSCVRPDVITRPRLGASRGATAPTSKSRASTDRAPARLDRRAVCAVHADQRSDVAHRHARTKPPLTSRGERRFHVKRCTKRDTPGTCSARRTQSDAVERRFARPQRATSRLPSPDAS